MTPCNDRERTDPGADSRAVSVVHDGCLLREVTKQLRACVEKGRNSTVVVVVVVVVVSGKIKDNHRDSRGNRQERKGRERG